MNKVKYCNKCDICIMNNHSPVWGSGCENTDIMFVGEAPGATERTKGLPFVGKAGQALRRILDMYGFTEQNAYFTNVVKCRPPANREPEPKEIINCIDYLAYEIQTINPKFIVLLGNTALRTFFWNENLMIGRNNGRVVVHGTKIVFPMYHPSFFIRNTDKLPDFEKAMDNLLYLYRLKNPMHKTKL